MESDYTTLQQPGTGNNTTGSNYGALQSPAVLYAQNTKGKSAGGSASPPAPAKTYILPDAETYWSKSLSRFPYVSKLPVFLKSLSYNQIKQQNIANCYLAATLASMANTKLGREVIKKMITPHKGAMTTICKKFDFNTPPGPEMQLKSDRWFTVSFKNQAVDVSDVLYHDDSDRDPNLQYLTTPNGDKALWGAIIEVAYAWLKGGYDNISASNGKTTLESFLSEFCSLDWDILHPDKDDDQIKKACSNAGTKPAFIATLTKAQKLTGWHGYSVLSMSGKNVKLWDPMAVKVVTITFEELLKEIQSLATTK